MGLFFNSSKDSSDSKVSFDIDTISAIFTSTEDVGHIFENNNKIYVFTSKRLIIVDSKSFGDENLGLISIPYRSIVKYSKANIGFNDLELDIYLWLINGEIPIVLSLGKEVDTNKVYRIISEHTL